METLFKKHNRLLALTPTDIIREMMNQVNWEAPMIAIRGPRGVGKSTLLLQYIKTHYEPYSREVLYCQMDSVYFSSHTLLDLAERFYQQGGQRLLLDEVHRRGGRGLYAVIGAQLSAAHHHRRFDFDERVLAQGCALLLLSLTGSAMPA